MKQVIVQCTQTASLFTKLISLLLAKLFASKQHQIWFRFSECRLFISQFSGSHCKIYQKNNRQFDNRNLWTFNISDGFLDFVDSPDMYNSVQRTNKGLNGVHCEHEDSILQLEENCIRISGTTIFMYIVLYNCKLSQLSKYNFTCYYRNHIYHIRL